MFAAYSKDAGQTPRWYRLTEHQQAKLLSDNQEK